jgi:hypothetical protein
LKRGEYWGGNSTGGEKKHGRLVAEKQDSKKLKVCPDGGEKRRVRGENGRLQGEAAAGGRETGDKRPAGGTGTKEEGSSRRERQNRGQRRDSEGIKWAHVS